MIDVKDVFVIVVLIAVAGFAGLSIYKRWKASGIDDKNVVEMITFILANVDYFVDSLQRAALELGGIRGEDFEKDPAYRQVLIDKAIHIIEIKAAESGIKLSLSHDTLVNLADLVITQVIKAIATRTEQQRLLDAVAATSEPVKDDKVDITGELNIELE